MFSYLFSYVYPPYIGILPIVLQQLMLPSVRLIHLSHSSVRAISRSWPNIEILPLSFQEYEMNMKFKEYNLYSMKNWKEMIKGVFSRYGLYHPKLTIYEPVNITLA